MSDDLRDFFSEISKSKKEKKRKLEEAKKEFESTHKKISMGQSQVNFQKEMGRLEVLGELIIKLGS